MDKTKAPSTVTPESIRAAFGKPIPRVRVSLAYRVTAIIVSFLMLLLPLTYIALMAGVGALIGWHAVENTGLLHFTPSQSRGSVFFAFITYITPILAGLIFLFFMIKPLFSRRYRPVEPAALRPEAEPAFFAFVNEVCRIVRAPAPKRILIDLDVNASARLGGGIFKLLWPRLTLTVGLPLIAGLDQRQLAGVLAHEFGHFSQGAGMRLTYVVRSISGWLGGVVYERDRFDMALADWSHNLDIRIALPLWVARAMIWLTRKILWLLMFLGHMFSCFLLRQMELDADRYEARVSGSDCFVDTTRRIHLLGMAAQGARQDLGRAWNENRLGDDLTDLILRNLEQIPPEVIGELEAQLEDAETGLFDTHPSGPARIRNARREKAEGVFHDESPSSALFSDFAQTSRDMTLKYYRAVIGPKVTPLNLISSEQLVNEQQAQGKDLEAMERYFQRIFSLVNPSRLSLDGVRAPDDPREAAVQLTGARRKLEESLPAVHDLVTRRGAAVERLTVIRRAQVLMRIGLKEGPADKFELREWSPGAAEEARTEAQADLEGAVEQLKPYSTAARERLLAALQLLHVPKMASRLPEAAAWLDEAKKLLPALERLEACLDTLNALRDEMSVAGYLAALLQHNPEAAAFRAPLEAALRRCFQHLTALEEKLRGAPYPFEHAGLDMSVARYAIGRLEEGHGLGNLMNHAGGALEKLAAMYFRILGRLAYMGQSLETAFGREVLPTPGAVK